MPTLNQVAKAAGVSITTASRVLNNGMHAERISAACAAKVRKVAAELGYTLNYHARSIRMGRAETLGVAIDIGEPEAGDFGNASPLLDSYFARVVGGIELGARRANNRITLIGPDKKARAPDRGLIEIRQRRIDGLVVFGPTIRNDKTDFASTPSRAPVVLVEYPGETVYPVVDFDERSGIELAVEHLAGLGHRSLLWLGEQMAGPKGKPLGREAVFLTAVAKRGLAATSCYVADYQNEKTDDIDGAIADNAQRALRELLAAKKRGFTGIMCRNDAVAMGAFGALAEAGVKVPADVSVIGFDDVRGSTAYPRMTTVSHRFHDMGLKATELLLRMVNDPKQIAALAGKRELIEPVLVVRNSTAAKGRLPK